MKKILWIILMAGLVFTFVGCEFLGELLAILAAPQGNVINAKTGDGVANVSVTITCLDTPEDGETAPGPFTATTTDTGYYTFAEVAYGNYELTATLDGYVFIKQVVSVSGLMQTLPDVVGFPYNAETDQYNISLIMMWNANFNDVDAYLTYPAADPTNDGVGAEPFYDVYDYAINYTYVDEVDAGFFPEFANGVLTSTSDVNAENSNYRMQIYHANKTSIYQLPDTTTPAVSLDVDDTNGRGPETITIATIPYADELSAISTTGGGNTGLEDLSSVNGGYSWVGVMEYYVNAYRSGDAVAAGDYLSRVDDGKSADVVIYVMQGDTLYGTYTIPTYTDMKTASVLRINMFLKNDGAGGITEHFQIAPDIKILQSTNMIKGADNGVINLQGRTR